MSQDNSGQIKENADFLQSEEWRKFQEATGKRTYRITGEDMSASVIEHELPSVGKYFYIPRWPVIGIMNYKLRITNFFRELMNLAKKNNIGWIRIEPENEEILDLIKKKLEEIRPRRTDYEVIRAPHDMQPREILVMDITKSEEELLAEMKPKTRYNINLAQKRGVRTWSVERGTHSGKYIEEFIKLVKLTAKRKGIKLHPRDYYRKMIENLLSDMLSLYIAEYNNKVIAANLVVFYNKTAIYLHGATDDEYRNVMAPYLLQWQTILDAKKRGCEFYDFGGIKTWNMKHGTRNKNSWAGISRFKIGFSPNTQPTSFPGSYDIIMNPFRYWLYRNLQLIKSIF